MLVDFYALGEAYRMKTKDVTPQAWNLLNRV